MEHPIRVAFCQIFFGANGGQFTELGNPIFYSTDEMDDGGAPVRGKCDRPYDCGTCPYMGQWVEGLQAQGWIIGWECYHCLKLTKETPRLLPGFYQTGRIPNPTLDDQPELLEGCTRCGWETSFLQLVLRKAGE